MPAVGGAFLRDISIVVFVPCSPFGVIVLIPSDVVGADFCRDAPSSASFVSQNVIIGNLKLDISDTGFYIVEVVHFIFFGDIDVNAMSFSVPVIPLVIVSTGVIGIFVVATFFSATDIDRVTAILPDVCTFGKCLVVTQLDIVAIGIRIRYIDLRTGTGSQVDDIVIFVEVCICNGATTFSVKRIVACNPDITIDFEFGGVLKIRTLHCTDLNLGTFFFHAKVAIDGDIAASITHVSS